MRGAGKRVGSARLVQSVAVDNAHAGGGDRAEVRRRYSPLRRAPLVLRLHASCASTMWPRDNMYSMKRMGPRVRCFAGDGQSLCAQPHHWPDGLQGAPQLWHRGSHRCARHASQPPRSCTRSLVFSPSPSSSLPLALLPSPSPRFVLSVRLIALAGAFDGLAGRPHHR